MQFSQRRAVAGALAACLTAHAALYGQDPALLQIRVVAGEGAVHTVGTRASQALLLRITDESGRPVPGASVSLRLPEEGPSGTFLTGLRTEVMTAGEDGIVSVRGIQWNRVAGPMQIRITASKGEIRSGTISAQYLTESAAGAKPNPEKAQTVLPQIKVGPSRGKWTMLALLIGGAAAGGVAAAASRGGRTPSTSMPPSGVSAPPVAIGPPSISIGQP